jgi:hypothetical protein
VSDPKTRRNLVRRTLWVPLTVVALVVAGCGGGDDEDSTATTQQAVCDDASSLEQSVDSLVDDITNLDFGSAKDQLTSIVAAATQLGESVQQLANDKKSDLEGQVDELETTIDDLTSAGSIDAIGQALDTAESQLQGILDTVTDTLSCS